MRSEEERRRLFQVFSKVFTEGMVEAAALGMNDATMMDHATDKAYQHFSATFAMSREEFIALVHEGCAKWAPNGRLPTLTEAQNMNSVQEPEPSISWRGIFARAFGIGMACAAFSIFVYALCKGRTFNINSDTSMSVINWSFLVGAISTISYFIASGKRKGLNYLALTSKQ